HTGTMESLAKMMAPRMAVATSLEHLTPRPTVVPNSNKSIEPLTIVFDSHIFHFDKHSRLKNSCKMLANPCLFSQSLV
ncbi:hypothetical protein ACQP3L_36275, partial [Escherichia coli]